MPGKKHPFLWGLLLMSPSCRFGYEMLEQLGPEADPTRPVDDREAGGANPGGPDDPGNAGAPTTGDGDDAQTSSGGAPDGEVAEPGGSAGAGQEWGGAGGAPYSGPLPSPEPPLVLSAGQSHTCGVSTAGTLFCWGSNSASALGAFVGAESPDPVPVGGEADQGGFVGVSAGRSSSCALRDDGTLWCWGANENGQLGQGDSMDRSLPAQVHFDRPIRAVSLNYSVVCAIDDAGQLFCWGWNDEGQAGQGDSSSAPSDCDVPCLVESNIPWTDVSAGDGHVCAVRADGALYCWGRNSSGELGRETPIQLRSPVRVGLDSNWKLVRSSQAQTCAIRNDSSLWCWGAGNQGQLGIEPPEIRKSPARVGSENDWTSVEPQALHTCGLRSDGSFWCWGRREEGQLVVGYDVNPVLIPFEIDPNKDWDLISAGRFHTCGRRSGTLLCTGENSDGRLGDGSLNRSYGFVEVQGF